MFHFDRKTQTDQLAKLFRVPLAGHNAACACPSLCLVFSCGIVVCFSFSISIFCSFVRFPPFFHSVSASLHSLPCVSCFAQLSSLRNLALTPFHSLSYNTLHTALAMRLLIPLLASRSRSLKSAFRLQFYHYLFFIVRSLRTHNSCSVLSLILLLDAFVGQKVISASLFRPSGCGVCGVVPHTPLEAPDNHSNPDIRLSLFILLYQVP